MTNSFQNNFKWLSQILAGTLGALAVDHSHAATLQVHWSGTVSYLNEFAPGAVPDGVAEGASVSGTLNIDLPDYDQYMSLNGSHSFGEAYRYSGGLSHTLTIGESQWSVVGGGVSFIYYSYEPKAAFDIFSTSDRSEYISFPNFVGPFELGYAFFAENSPPIFSLSDGIEEASFDLEQSAYANGFLSSRLWDENDDIVDGYYLTFDITSISSAVVPEPSSATFALAGTSLLWLRRDRKRLSPS